MTTPSNAEDLSEPRLVRELVRGAVTATLATLDGASGHAYASLVETATLADGRPVMLLSGLARHTRNLLADGRASLLFDRRCAQASPLTGLRATLIGMAEPTCDPLAGRRYLQRFPEARGYASFADFGFWVLRPGLVHFVAGFGQIGEMGGDRYLVAGDAVQSQAPSEEGLIARVNELAERRNAAWRCIGVDFEGVDYRTIEGVARCTWTWTGDEEKSPDETIYSAISQCNIS